MPLGRGGPGLARRDSGNALQVAPSRPLAAKFRALMEYLQVGQRGAWAFQRLRHTRAPAVSLVLVLACLRYRGVPC